MHWIMLFTVINVAKMMWAIYSQKYSIKLVPKQEKGNLC